MKGLINRILDNVADFLAHRKGFLPIVGIIFVFTNWLLQLLFMNSWLSETNFFLHLGVIIAIVGILIAWAL